MATLFTNIKHLSLGCSAPAELATLPPSSERGSPWTFPIPFHPRHCARCCFHLCSPVSASKERCGEPEAPAQSREVKEVGGERGWDKLTDRRTRVKKEGMVGGRVGI